MTIGRRLASPARSVCDYGTRWMDGRLPFSSMKVDIPPSQISQSNLACLNRILACTKYFTWEVILGEFI
jgi:hypothetical protein